MPAAVVEPVASTDSERRTRWVRRSAWGLVAAVLVFAAWFWLAPPALGGGTSYAVTTGASMRPEYAAGDLVLLRSQPTYRVGEIAAYHDPRLNGALILHEIVAVRGGRYTLRGLASRTDDGFRPARAQVVGAVWVHVGGIGASLLTLRDPWIAVALGVLLLAGILLVVDLRRRRRGVRPPPQRLVSP